MAQEKDIEQEIDQIKALQGLIQAYEEIASFRMKKTRDSVIKNRQYMSEINDIFDQVRLSYAREARRLAKLRGKAGEERITFLAHNGKTVAVFLSANTGLYGDIVPNTFKAFIKEARKGESEVTIVGKYGLSMFLTEEPDRPYTYFDIPDYGFTTKDMDKLIRHIVLYEEIHIYHGQFVNVIRQRPNMVKITAEISLEEDDEDDGEAPYIFEPSLDQILIFFETQIFSSLIDQASREGQLAKFASRVMAMNKADENIRGTVSRLNFEKLRVKHRATNRKQLNSLSGIYMRGK